MSRRNQAANNAAKKNAPAAPKAPESPAKLAKSTSTVLMLANIMHDGILFANGEHVTLEADVFSLFVSKGYATAVEVAESDVTSDSDPQSQGAGNQTGDATTTTDPETAPVAGAETVPATGDATGATDAGGDDAKTDGAQAPSNS